MSSSTPQQIRVWQARGTNPYLSQPSVTVLIPARNEAKTVGAIVTAIRTGCTSQVDQVLVVDDGSTDETSAAASAAGAEVRSTEELVGQRDSRAGKGHAMWAGLRAVRGDVVVFCDADLEAFTPSYIDRLVEPLACDPSVVLAKAFYERAVDSAGQGGGRTTELLARPLLALLFPELATLRQPLSGEFALRRNVAEQMPFVKGYGVEAGLLIDVLRAYGSDSIVQCDVGIKRHRHRSIEELAKQAQEIASVVLSRAGAISSEAITHSECSPLQFG